MRFGTPPRVALAILLLALGAACGGPDVEGHVRKGDEYVAQQMFREASIEYRNALQAEPSRGDVRLKLGDVYLRLQDVRGALGEYVRAADLLPSDVTAQVKAGGLLLRAGQFEDAKTRVEKALALDAKNVDAQVLLGNALAGLKDLDGALGEYQEALALNPEKNEAYQNIGTVQMVRGRLPEAEAAFRKAVEVAPKSVPVRLALANFFWAAGRRADAEQSLKDTLAIDPKNLVANRALGVFYVASNQLDAAEPYFRTIAETAKTDESLIGLADYYIIGKRYDDAKPILRDLAGRKERYSQAMLRLAAIDAAIDNRVEAHVKVREVLAVEPANMAARLFSARLLLLEGKRNESLSMARTIVKDEPQSPESAGAFQLIGTLETAADHSEEAIKAFQEVIKRAPKAPVAHLALARLYRARGEWESAATHAQAILADAPKQPDARAELVRIWLSQGQPARAAEELASLRREYPNALGVLLLTAAQQLTAGQPDAARASYVRVRSADSGNLEALAGIVSIDLARGRGKDAVATAEESLKSVAPSGGLFIIAARAHLAAANPSRAEELLKKAIEVDPARLQAYSLLGVIYARQNRLDEAEGNFAEIVKRNPSSVSGRTMLAMIYDSQRRAPEAEAAYKEVLALDPEAPVAANNLAWIYVSSGRNMTDALQLARTAHKYLPNEPNVNDTLGWIYYREKRFEEAIRHLETSVKAGTEDPSIHYHLGMAYANFGYPEKARQALTRAVASTVEFEGKPDARKTLAALN